MRHRPRYRHALIPPLALTAAATMLTAAGEPGADVTVSVSGLRSAKGNVLVCMTRASKSFPDCRSDATALKAKVAAGHGATVHFDHVPQGRWAVAVLHDENGNGKADRVMGMMPKEGFGFSRDAPVRMGPPKFADAVFEVGGGDVVQPVRMRYMF